MPIKRHEDFLRMLQEEYPADDVEHNQLHHAVEIGWSLAHKYLKRGVERHQIPGDEISALIERGEIDSLNERAKKLSRHETLLAYWEMWMRKQG